VRRANRWTSAAGKTGNGLYTALRATFEVSESVILCFSRLALGGQEQVNIAAHIALVLAAHAAFGQGSTSRVESSEPTIRSASALVIVPTLVQSTSGEFVANLDAGHFRLLDNGREQKVFVEQTLNQPLAVVVLVQNGGAASSQLQNYGKLDTILESALGSSTRTIALMTFDSRPKEIWDFPPRVDGLYYSLTHQEGGDHGAAILDALQCATGLLHQQPANLRRIILLLSQSQDDGSTAHAEDVVRSLAESGTTIYSVTFTPAKAGLKSHSTRPARRMGTALYSPANSATLGETSRPSIPLEIMKAMREDPTAEVTALSGGERLRFQDEQELERGLSIVARDIQNSYTLSFYPTSHEIGFHALTVQVVPQHPHLEVKSRASYWLGGTATK
jgi:VWFA-related protein